MEYVDFQIGAWKSDDAHVQVMAHATPVNTMRQPMSVTCDFARLNSLAGVFDKYESRDSADRITRAHRLGDLLSRLIFPKPVYSLLTASLNRLPPERGVRVRLCLDEHLVGLPWELVSLPGLAERGFPENCAAMDERISIVREAPITQLSVEPATEKQRLVFAAAMDDRGGDCFLSAAEYRAVEQALQSVKSLVDVEFVTASGQNIGRALARPCDIFHYSGHTDVVKGRSYLTREVITEERTGKRLVRGQTHSDPWSGFGSRFIVDPLYGEDLGAWLQQAGVKLAVFSACNSSTWGFVEPLIRAGVPAVIGAHNWLWSDTGSAFAGKLYSLLALGLSLDEAVIWASDHLLKSEPRDPLAWAQFALYMPSTSATLFPRPDLRPRLDALRQERQEQRKTEPPREWQTKDKTKLRENLTNCFDKAELDDLCRRVQAALENDQIRLERALTVENVGGETRPEIAMRLVDYLDRRGYLDYLERVFVELRGPLR